MIYDDDLPFGYLTVCELDFMAHLYVLLWFTYFCSGDCQFAKLNSQRLAYG